MWDYTGKVLDHFRNPRNVGIIEDADGIGEVGSLACGDALKLYFKLDGDGRISDVKFQTFGCASAIASSSALTEMVKGMTLEAAGRVTNQDIADYLGGLPEQKMHCSVMGREALEAAIDSYRSGRQGRKKMLSGKVVCNCFGVTEEEIERVTRENRLTTVEQVTNYTKAGGGCGKCKGAIEAIVERVARERVEAERKSGVPAARKLTTIEKIRLIEQTLDKQIRPMLKKDGGDIQLIDVEGNTVKVALRGMCAGCIGARSTLEDVVGAKLREFVSADLKVEEAES
jgi:NifU-like protein